jgi:hypothetical protein
MVGLWDNQHDGIRLPFDLSASYCSSQLTPVERWCRAVDLATIITYYTMSSCGKRSRQPWQASLARFSCSKVFQE